MPGKDIGNGGWGRRRWLSGLLGLAVVVILVATLTPGSNTITADSLCLVCGERGTADAILNVVLFLPVGLLLALRLDTNRGALLLLLVLFSTTVEVTQIFIPGRDASLGDIVFNTVGGALGLYLAAHAPALLWPEAARARRLGACAAVGAAAVWLATSVLFRPALPRTVKFYGAWTPQYPNMQVYRGRVLAASLGPVAVPRGQLQRPDRIRDLLTGGRSISVLALAGPPSTGPAPLFALEGARTIIVFLGVDGGSLLYRYRTAAVPLRLDNPDFRLPGALAGVAPGDTLHIRVRRDLDSPCLQLNNRLWCGVGHTLGDGWQLLDAGGVPSSMLRFVGMAWMALLLFPAGFWSKRGWPAAAGLALAAAVLVLAPRLGTLLPTPPSEIAAAVAGFLGGALLRFSLRRRLGNGGANGSLGGTDRRST